MKIHPPTGQWAARLAGWLAEEAGGGTRVPAIAPAAHCLPHLDTQWYRQTFPAPVSWIMGNACLRWKCTLTSRVKWIVKHWQEAAWRFALEVKLLAWQL